MKQQMYDWFQTAIKIPAESSGKLLSSLAVILLLLLIRDTCIEGGLAAH